MSIPQGDSIRLAPLAAALRITQVFGAASAVNIETVALRKLAMLARAANLQDLRIPPSNRLEARHGKRKGQYSIRINDQWRVCFRWTDQGAEQVEIVDYH